MRDVINAVRGVVLDTAERDGLAAGRCRERAATCATAAAARQVRVDRLHRVGLHADDTLIDCVRARAVDGIIVGADEAVGPSTPECAVAVVWLAHVLAAEDVALAPVAELPARHDGQRREEMRVAERVYHPRCVAQLAARNVSSFVVVPCAHRGCSWLLKMRCK